jgi:RND family efflux transporter MFP subunit
MKCLAVPLLMLALPLAAAAEIVKSRLEWAHTVDLRFVEDGVLAEVPVVVGQSVKANAVLAALDPREFELARREAAARVTRAEAAVARAERQLHWTAELYDRGLIADNERLEAEEDAAAARAELEAARAGLGQAEVALERTVLRAPFDGIVVSVQAWPGQVIVKQLQQDPPVVVADARRMVARARLTAERMQAFAPGQALQVRVGRGGWRKGQVYRLGVETEDIIDRGAVYALDVLFEAWPDETFRPGQFAAVDLGP